MFESGAASGEVSMTSTSSALLNGSITIRTCRFRIYPESVDTDDRSGAAHVRDRFGPWFRHDARGVVTIVLRVPCACPCSYP